MKKKASKFLDFLKKKKHPKGRKGKADESEEDKEDMENDIEDVQEEEKEMKEKVDVKKDKVDVNQDIDVTKAKADVTQAKVDSAKDKVDLVDNVEVTEDKVELLLSQMEKERSDLESQVYELEEQMVKRNMRLKQERYFCKKMAELSNSTFEKQEIEGKEIKQLKESAHDVQKILQRFSFKFLIPQLIKKKSFDQQVLQIQELAQQEEEEITEEQKRQYEEDDRKLQEIYEQHQEQLVWKLYSENVRLKENIQKLIQPNSKEQREHRKLERKYQMIDVMSRHLLTTQIHLCKDFQVFKWHDKQKKKEE